MEMNMRGFIQVFMPCLNSHVQSIEAGGKDLSKEHREMVALLIADRIKFPRYMFKPSDALGTLSRMEHHCKRGER